MQIKVRCVGGPADDDVFTVSGFVDYFHVVVPPPFHVYDAPAMLEVEEAAEIHAYKIDHQTRCAHYKGRE